MGFVYANNINTTLASPITTTTQTSVTLSSSANLPTLSGGQTLVVTLCDAATQSVFEVLYVTNISGATLTVSRGQEGTAATTWLAGDYAYAAVTAGILDTFASSSGTVTQVNAGTGISSTGGTTPTLANTGLLSVTTGAGISSTGGQNPTLANTGILAVSAGAGLASTGGSSPTISWSPTNYFFGGEGNTNSQGKLSVTVGYQVVGASGNIGQNYGGTNQFVVFLDQSDSNFALGIVVFYGLSFGSSPGVIGAGLGIFYTIVTNNVVA